MRVDSQSHHVLLHPVFPSHSHSMKGPEPLQSAKEDLLRHPCIKHPGKVAQPLHASQYHQLLDHFLHAKQLTYMCRGGPLGVLLYTCDAEDSSLRQRLWKDSSFWVRVRLVVHVSEPYNRVERTTALYTVRFVGTDRDLLLKMGFLSIPKAREALAMHSLTSLSLRPF